MLDRFTSPVALQSPEYYEAVRRAEEAAQPPPPKIDTRKHIRNPANGWTYVNPQFGQEIE